MEDNQKSRSVGLHSDSETDIQLLRDILDRYSSQDIIREIVQNADDAGASELVFFVLEEGISSAHPDTHPLLKNSALLIFNNAPLKKEDTKGITFIIKGTKQEDSTKIGRFGLGLKSLFHVCEAFFFGPYRSPDKDIEAQLFDPWCDIRCNYADKLPQWTNTQVNNALNSILSHLENFLGASYKDSFFMYIPFRDNDTSKLMLKKLNITASSFINDARICASLPQLPLSLAQCSFLKKVSFFTANSLSELAEHKSLYEFSIQRKNCLRRPQQEKKGFAEPFICSMSVSRQGLQDSIWECLGINRFAPNHEGLQKLHNDARWPVVNLAGDPEKSLPNAAITILHNRDSNDKRLSLRWASFLPLDDRKPEDNSDLPLDDRKTEDNSDLPLDDRKTEDNSDNDLVQTIPAPYLQGTWEILLHGYFFLSSDRKHIFGITKTGEDDIKQQWNRLLVQQLLFPLFPRILRRKIKDDPQNESLIDAVRLWNRFAEFSEDMTSSCFLVKLVKNDAWEIHTEPLYMLPEGIPPSLKGWLEREFRPHVALKDKGLYSPLRHMKQWDEDSFSQICQHFPATPEELAESDIFWIQKFIRDIKEENRYRQHLRKWLLRTLQNRLFDSKNEKVRSALYFFAEKVFQNAVCFMPMKTETILRSIARDRPELLSPCLILPRAEDKAAPPSSQTLPENIPDEQRIALLRFLGEEKLNDREKQSEGCILLADRLVAGRQIPELDTLPFYRVSIFFQGKQKEEAARSFQELQLKKEVENCLFKQPASGGGISDTLKQLSLVLEDTEIWLLRTEATLESGLPTWEATLFEALVTNKLSPKEEIRRAFFEYILKKLFAENKENSLCIQALKNLLAGKHVEENIKFVLYSDTLPAVHEQWLHKYLFIPKDKYRYLSEEHKKALAIVEEHSIASEQLRDILSDAEPWQFLQYMINLCPNPRKDIPDDLEDLFRTACWIPAAQGGGLAPNHILRDEVPAILKKALPSSWMCREKLSATLEQLCTEDERLWIMKALDALDHEQEQELRCRQLMELFQDENFRAPCTFFPPQLDDLAKVAQHLRHLAANITTTGQEEHLLFRLLSLPEIPPAALQKFQSAPSTFDRKTCRYDILLHAAPAYARIHAFTPLLPFYARYLAAARQHDEKLFARDYLFPTRKEGVWKKGHEITEEQRCREDSAHLEESVWEACRSFFSSDNKTPSDKGRSSAQYIEKYFSVPFAKAEKYRVACLLRLIAGKNDDIRVLAEKFSSNISNELTNIFGFDFDDTCWDFRISAAPSDDQEKSLAGYPFKENKITFFTCTLKNKIYYLYFYKNKAGKPAENQEDFTERLKKSISEWLKQFNKFKKDPQKISEIINRFSPTQHSLSATTALLKEDLRTVIEQLRIKDFNLKEKQIDIYNKIQYGEGPTLEKLKKELWDIAQDKKEIYEAILKKIQNYGYREEGVLLELIQNADDALRERSEPKKRSVTIDLHERILSFSHYGRPINEKKEGETSGSNDLYSMLMLNRSEKESHSVTGKLGLGFKSVFLLSEQPVIQSKALCFSIKNGMFPQEEKTRLDTHDDEVTLFRLPLKPEIPDEEIKQRIFSRVSASAALIPVFAHEIRELVININGDEEKFTCNPDASDRGQDWIADYNAHVLVFSDPKTGIQLAVRLDENRRPTRFPDTMPPLWHTLPTVSGLDWRLGYAINGPFSLNAGRSNIAPVKEDFTNLVKFGEVLGKSLCDYVQFVKKACPDAIAAHNHALWMVLSRGLESPEDSLQGKIVRSLHAEGRGLSYWLTQQGVPCGIPEEWSWPLKGIPPRWHTCSFPSDNARQNFSQTVQKLRREHFTDSLARLAYVPLEQSPRFKALGFPVEHMETADFFTAFFARLIPDKRLTSHLLSCLRQIREELPRQNFPFRVRTQAGTWEDIRQVLLPPNTPCELSSDFREEQRRAAFAPPHALLSEKYVNDREDAETYRRLRNGHTVTPDILQGWITELESPDQRKQVLIYLQEGELRHELLVSLRNEQQGWIRDFSLVGELLASMTENDDDHKQILMALFPDAFVSRTSPAIDEYESEEGEEYEEEDTPVPAISSRSHWEAMLAFWQQNKEAVVRDYVAKTWPAQFRNQDLLKERLEKNDRCAWLVLLLLGYLQSIGRSKPEMHRTFVQELLTKHDSLFTKKLDKDDPKWLLLLSSWQDANISTNTYAMWITCFPALHQFSRFLKQYQNILGSMVRGKLDRKQLLDCFSPRSASAFQQAGKQFDAPPFPLRLGKYWVLRELARLNFKNCQTTSGEAFLECCWVPRKRCCDILGMDYAEDTDERQAKLVSTLLRQNETLPHFDYCFDIALCAMRK